jgi:hypothetical protein
MKEEGIENYAEWNKNIIKENMFLTKENFNLKAEIEELKIKWVYAKWNPLHERIVCAHENSEDTCLDCENEEEAVKGTAYSLEGKWCKIVPSTIQLEYCYCGKPVDTYYGHNLCEEHTLDAQAEMNTEAGE